MTIYYSLTNAALGQHENTAEVTALADTTGEPTGDEDANDHVLATDDLSASARPASGRSVAG